MDLKFSDLVQRLEAERNDISYRKRITKPEVKVVTKTLKVIPERFKRIYFHAGRYAAGDCDNLAIQAWSEYEELENL
jgi:hypothetical protein